MPDIETATSRPVLPQSASAERRVLIAFMMARADFYIQVGENERIRKQAEADRGIQRHLAKIAATAQRRRDKARNHMRSIRGKSADTVRSYDRTLGTLTDDERAERDRVRARLRQAERRARLRVSSSANTDPNFGKF